MQFDLCSPCSYSQMDSSINHCPVLFKFTIPSRWAYSHRKHPHCHSCPSHPDSFNFPSNPQKKHIDPLLNHRQSLPTMESGNGKKIDQIKTSILPTPMATYYFQEIAFGSKTFCLNFSTLSRTTGQTLQRKPDQSTQSFAGRYWVKKHRTNISINGAFSQSDLGPWRL